MITVTLARPWLLARFAQELRCLSHAPFGAGYTMSRSVLWREVRNSDLAPDFDAESWLAKELTQAPVPEGAAPAAVAMLTSRDVGSWCEVRAEVGSDLGESRAHCLVTLGLSNAEAVGSRLPWHPADGTTGPDTGGAQGGYGTINMLVATDAGLTEAAQLEALTIAVEARTAALMDLDLQLATGRATGTGTDCTVLACPPGQGRYAGLHTPVGEAVGRATRRAVMAAGQDWLRWYRGARG